MRAWVARIVAVVKHLPVLPPAQAVIEGVHQLPRARSDVSPGHILPAIESVLAQGILCTERGVSDRGIPSCIETTTAMRLDRGRYQEEVIIGGHRQPASRAGQYLHRFRPPQAADPVETVRLLAGLELIAFAAGALRGQEANRPDTVCHQAEIPHQLRKALLRDPQVGLGIGSAIHSLRHSQVQLAYFRRVAVFPLAEMLVDTDEPRLRTPVRAFPLHREALGRETLFDQRSDDSFNRANAKDGIRLPGHRLHAQGMFDGNPHPLRIEQVL